MQLEWELKENNKFEEKINELTHSPVISQILANRGIDTYAKASEFLNPDLKKFSNPLNFVDLQKATDRIKSAIKNGENIVICGDFDCDGVTSTAVLYKTLVELGAKVGCYIPNRKTESHGLNSKAIVEIISKQKAKLIITVDNGISNIKEINLAKSLGTDIIITDHHEPPEELPAAYAIINPKCTDKISSALNFDEIKNMNSFAGVMVVYKLCCNLLDEFNKSDFKEILLPYVMLGTISDVMPLINENRTLVINGLNIINNVQPKWLKKLFSLAGRKTEDITSETLAFTIAPRINAAGRLEHATTALELMVSDDEEKIDLCANQLNQYNQNRQQMCDTSFFEANSRILSEIDLKTTKAIVLADEKWHIGIVGLLASRIVETYNRPAFIMTIDKEENMARCSIRGIKGLNIHKVLMEMSEYFLGFGGHEMAGGFSADLNKYTIRQLSEKINKIVSEHLEGNSLQRKFPIDLILKPEELTVEFIEQLKILEPYGEGNPSCVFGLENMTLKKINTIGDNAHLKMLFSSSDNKFVFEGIIWNKNLHNIELLDVADLTFVPQINEYKGNKNIQLIIKNIFIKNREIKNKNFDFDENAEKQALLVDHRKKNNFLKMLNSYLSKNKSEIFVENKSLSEQISDYNNIKSCAFGRYDLKPCEELIMLSSPCSEDDFSQIIKNTGATKIHIFNAETPILEINNFIKIFSGMLKYCSTHNDGNIDINKSITYLSVTEEVFTTAMSLFQEVGVINITDTNADNYIFSFLSAKPLKEFINAQGYEILQNELDKINSFKEEFQNCDFAKIKEMLNV